jgi:hypothetical protein
MEKLNLKAELYEIQVWLMWIFALWLFETDHFVLFGIVLAWSIFTAIGVLVMHAQDTKE